jgi:hypothetical protein
VNDFEGTPEWKEKQAGVGIRPPPVFRLSFEYPAVFRLSAPMHSDSTGSCEARFETLEREFLVGGFMRKVKVLVPPITKNGQRAVAKLKRNGKSVRIGGIDCDRLSVHPMGKTQIVQELENLVDCGHRANGVPDGILEPATDEADR